MNNLKLLGFLINSSLVDKNVSGTRGFLGIHLKKLGIVSHIFDLQLKRELEYYYLIKNFLPNKQSWSFRRSIDIGRRKAMSEIAEKLVSNYNLYSSYNATLQIGSLFNLSKINKLKNIPKFSYHDNNLAAYLKSSHSISNFNKKKIKQAFNYEKDVYENLDLIFTMTEFLRQSFIKDFEIPEHKVINIGFAANTHISEIKNKEYDGKTILFIAKDSFKEKGGYTVIEAFRKVKKEIKDAKLIIVGQKIKISEGGIINIDFIDKTTLNGADQYKNLFRHASVFVMPSFVEAAGNVFVEAMSAGIAVIGARTSAMPEIILENNCGNVIEPGNSDELANIIINYLKDKKLLKELGDNGIKAVKTKYNWDIICQKFLDFTNTYI